MPGPDLRVEIGSARARGKLSRIGEALVLLILFAVSLEGACRVEDWIQFRTPVLAPERSQEDLLVRDALGMHGRAGGHWQKWSLNAFGMRGPDVPAVKPANVIRVVTVGASETFGLYESPGHEYPRQLEDSLNAGLSAPRGECRDRRAQVLNAAMPGMSLPTIDQDIRLRVAALRPDFVVLYATPSVYLDDGAPVAARPDSSVRVASRLPAARTLYPRLADRLRVQIKSLLPTVVQDRIRQREIKAMLAEHPAGWRFDSVPVDRLTNFGDDLRHTIGTIRSTGATPVLMTHANRFAGADLSDVATLRAWEKFYPRASGQTIVAFDSAARLITLAVARDSQTIVVDLASTLARSPRHIFADYSHFTDEGAALVAKNVAAATLGASGSRQLTCLNTGRN
jgi:lysophospholipase L1-like esterase